MRNSKRTRTKTRIGSSLLLLLVGAAGVAGAERGSASYALVAGTVYRPPGFAMSGAEVRIIPQAKVVGGQKLKETKVLTDARGEFAVRVPAVPAQWTVHVQRDGYQSQTKFVSIEGEQRLDLSFVLEPAGKGEGK